MAIIHPREPLTYPDAIEYVEKWLTENHLTDADRARDFSWKIYDYHDRNPEGIKERPWVGVRVSEVDVSCSSGGGSYMQIDHPWGVAFCGQVERCILALVEGWNQDTQQISDGEEYGETDEEFWRLGHLIELANDVTPDPA